MENTENVLQWLLAGDISVQYQVKRDLLDARADELKALQIRIPFEGWCRQFLSMRNPRNGRWGEGWYSPKWISTHYTLLDLKNLCIPPTHKAYSESSRILLETMWTNKGMHAKGRYLDLCVGAMILSISSYARIRSPKINEIIDYLGTHQSSDGGWNCSWDRGSTRSSLHTTLTVLECIRDLETNGYTYGMDELKKMRKATHEMLLKRNLFKSLSTGEAIDKKMLMLSYPSRWKYDTLRCLDYFRSIAFPYDNRMQEALKLLIKKRRKNGKWPVQQKYAGLVHFDMEETGTDSRWNTLRALRVLKLYKGEK